MSAPGRGVVARGLGPGRFPHQLAWVLDNPLRRLIVPAERVVGRLPLDRDSAVLEVGPGSGYFSLELARRLPAGRLELLDVQPEMLAKAQRKLAAAGFRDVGYVAHDAGAGMPYPDHTFDVALLVAVLGEIEDRASALAQIHRVLRPGGVLAVHEHVPDPDRIRFGDLLAIGEAAGYRLRSHFGPAWNYTALFER